MPGEPRDELLRAIAALESGRPAEAIRVLHPFLGVSDDSRIALVVGEAARVVGDDAQLDKAADRLIAQNPSLVRPLIWKGDLRLRAGEARQALQYYTAALARADERPQAATLRPELQRIGRVTRQLHADLSDHLDRFLTANGLPETHRSERIDRSLRILAGAEEVELQLQRPTVHFVPDLPQKGWYDRKDFSWVPAIEAQTDAIRAELLSLLREDGVFSPYIEGSNHGPTRDYQGLLNNPAWSAFYFWRDGQRIGENLARCPATTAALDAVPRPAIAGRSPTAMFSLLRPQTRIPPHHGMLNARLIAHLPLIVPEGCAMRVGEETRAWHEGEVAMFDDSVEHAAWNDSDQLRVILLFDIARPELDCDEAHAVDLCFRAMDAYDGSHDSLDG